MSAILLLGFLVGMRHAMEGDHLAAVATLATRSHSLGHTVWQGAVWGLGHTVTLFAVCSMVLFLDAVIPERLALGLEAAVGAMLVLLGLDVIRRLTQERIHFHPHRHQDGTTHMHAHSHQGGGLHDSEHHQHAHPRRFPLRALLVGLVHGMAGSAALILLTLPTAHPRCWGWAMWQSSVSAPSLAWPCYRRSLPFRCAIPPGLPPGCAMVCTPPSVR